MPNSDTAHEGNSDTGYDGDDAGRAARSTDGVPRKQPPTGAAPCADDNTAAPCADDNTTEVDEPHKRRDPEAPGNFVDRTEGEIPEPNEPG